MLSANFFARLSFDDSPQSIISSRYSTEAEATFIQTLIPSIHWSVGTCQTMTQPCRRYQPHKRQWIILAMSDASSRNCSGSSFAMSLPFFHDPIWFNSNSRCSRSFFGRLYHYLTAANPSTHIGDFFWCWVFFHPAVVTVGTTLSIFAASKRAVFSLVVASHKFLAAMNVLASSGCQVFRSGRH